MTRAEKQPISHNTSLRGPQESKIPDDGFDVNDPLKMYLREIRTVPLLTLEQEVEVATRVEEGRIAREQLVKQGNRLSLETKTELRLKSSLGRSAEDELVIKNRRLVVSIAKKYQSRGMPFIDLISEGNIGLMRAAKKYDLKRGYRFTTYATFWIRQAIGRAIADQGRTIRIPVHAGDLTRKILGISKRLTQELHRDPTPEEIALEAKMQPKKVVEYLQRGRMVLSLQQPTDSEGEMELGDLIQNDEEPSPVAVSTQNLLKEHLQQILEFFPPRDVQVLSLRYGLNDGGPGLTLEATGQKMGVTRERIRQIEAKALARLRAPSIRRKLEDYLDEDGEF